MHDQGRLRRVPCASNDEVTQAVTLISSPLPLPLYGSSPLLKSDDYLDLWCSSDIALVS